MPWLNLDDQFPKHPKVLTLSDAAFRLHVAGLCHAAQYRTDGLLTVPVVPLLVPRYRPRTLAELIGAGLWHDEGLGCGTAACPAGQPAHYVVHDFLQWNRSRDEIDGERERLRAVRSAAGKKGAAARWGRAG